MTHVVHTIPPTYDQNSRVLVLGSVPSPKSREAGFNYGHPQNRFWRVLAALADEPVPLTTERRRDFCLRHHIALWDVVAECDIEGASDASIKNARANDLALIAKHSPIQAVFCTGAKAYELYRRLGCKDATGIDAIKLPSTSPANAACKMEALMGAYAQVLELAGSYEPPVLDVAQVVQLEQAIAANGTSLAELMDRAGAALAYRIGQLLQGPAAQMPQGSDARTAKAALVGNADLSEKRSAARTVIFCGNGNNGGDGWVAGELLAREGRAVTLVCAKLPAELRAQPAKYAAARSLETLRSLGALVVRENSSEQVRESESDHLHVLVNPSGEKLEGTLAGSSVIVDAILGTGFDSDVVKAPFAEWIEAINRHAEYATVIAADVPSGVSAQNGYDPAHPHTHAEAAETVTMIAPKPGLAAPACGRVRVAPLAYIESMIRGTIT